MTTTKNESELGPRALANGRPDVNALNAEFKRAAPYGGNNLKVNDDVRFCRWAGKHADGKKHGTSTKGAFPFENASDLDPHVADELVEWLAAVSFLAFWRSWLALKAGGTIESNYAVKLADWIINQHLDEELGLVEVELSENYRLTYGWVVLYVHWVFEVSLRYETLKLEQLAAQLSVESFAGAESPDVLSAFKMMIQDPLYEAQVLEMIKPVLNAYREAAIAEAKGKREVKIPELSDKFLRGAVKALRETGAVEVPTPYVCHNGPEISALKPWRDVVLKSSAADVKRSRIIWHREYIDEAEADARVLLRGWNQKFVEELRKQKGKVSTWIHAAGATPNDTKPTTIAGAMAGEGETWSQENGEPDLMEVITAVYRQNDENGVPGIYATVFHPAISHRSAGSTLKADECYAEHGLAGESEGRGPYVVIRREVVDRPVTTSRGLPETVNAWQRVTKVHLDGMVDLLGIGVHPPLNIYDSVFGVKYKWAPGEHNMVKKGFEPSFPEVPLKGLAPSEAMVEIAERRAGRRAGRKHADIDPGESDALVAKNSQTFLMGWSAALKRAVCLCQEQMPDAEFARITGAPAGWLEARRGQAGLMGAKLEFDIKELDPAYVQNMLKAINEGVLADDVMGVTDRTKLTKWKWQLINSRMARELVQDEGQASQKMMDEVMLQVALMWQGNEPKYVENDAAAMRKLEFLQQIVKGNPLYGKALFEDPNLNPRFTELLKKYVDHLMFQKEQMVDNKQIGRVGVKPGSLA